MKKHNKINHYTTNILLIMSLLITFIMTGCSPNNKNNNRTANIDILQVGKADAIIISDNEHTIVIDCGESDDGDKIVSKLKEQKVDKIDYLIITHFDKDHVGGAAEVINSYKIDNIIEPAYTPENPNSEEYISYREAIKNKNYTVTTLNSDNKYSVGSISFDIMTANGKTFNDKIDNNNSLMIGLEHVGNSFLFAGDVEKERINKILKTGIKTYDFLKVPHHGNYNSSSKAFFNAISPKYAAITCSSKNPADDKVIESLEKLKCKIYYTMNGDINITSDKNGIKIKQ